MIEINDIISQSEVQDYMEYTLLLPSSKWLQGNPQKPCSFDGNQFFKMEEINSIENEFTVMFWCRLGVDKSCNRTVLSRGLPGQEDYFKIFVQGNGLIRFSAEGRTTCGCGAVDDNLWHHVTITYNGENLKIYLDNLLEGSPIYVFTDTVYEDGNGFAVKISGDIKRSEESLCIGALSDGSDGFKGYLDDLRIYDRELCTDEIKNIVSPMQEMFSRTPVKNPKDVIISDPVWKSCKDGCTRYNPLDGKWYYFFMQIRNCDDAGESTNWKDVSDHYGTSIGINVSEDRGLSWRFIGTVEGIYLDEGLNTLWAPDILWNPESRKFHLLVSYIKGVHKTFGNPYNDPQIKSICHFTSSDLFNWKFVNKYNFSKANIDAHINRLPDNRWGMWYKDETTDRTGFAVSEDLYRFEFVKFIGDEMGIEGAEVFKWKGFYWLLGDDLPSYNGSRVYRSKDCYNWTKVSNILTGDAPSGLYKKGAHHPDVVVADDDTAYVFYWTTTSEKNSGNDYIITTVTRLIYDSDKEELIAEQKGTGPDFKLPLDYNVSEHC